MQPKVTENDSYGWQMAKTRILNHQQFGYMSDI